MPQGTKEYRIVINGIEQSVSQVDALISKLNALENKINAVNGQQVATTPSGGSSQQVQQAKQVEQVQSQVTAEIERQNQAISQQTQLVQQGVTINREALEIATSILGTYDDNIAKLAEYDNELKKIAAEKKAVRDIGVENDQTRAIMADIVAREQQLKQLKSETQSIVKTETKMLQSQEGSYDQMSAALGRMRDALRAGGNSLSPEQFQKISAAVDELDRGLKDADKSMGNFARNVGNYASAAEGFEKIKITIAGTTKEFDSARTAIMSLKNAMAQLAVEGKTNTDEYRDLASQMKNLQLAMISVNDEIDKAKSASSGLHTAVEAMQGLVAIGTIGQGFANLFGIDDDEVTKSIQRITSLMGVLQGLKELSTQIATGTGIGPTLKKVLDISGVNNNFAALKENLTEVGRRMGIVKTEAVGTAGSLSTLGLAAKTAGSAAVALGKSLGMALAATGIVWAVSELISALQQLGKELKDMISVTDDYERRLNSLKQNSTLTADALKYAFQNIDNDVLSGKISEADGYKDKLNRVSVEIRNVADIYGDFSKKVNNTDWFGHKYLEVAKADWTELNKRIAETRKLEGEGGKVRLIGGYSDAIGDLIWQFQEAKKQGEETLTAFAVRVKENTNYQWLLNSAIANGNTTIKSAAQDIKEMTNQLYDAAIAGRQVQQAMAAAGKSARDMVAAMDKYGKNWQAGLTLDNRIKELDALRDSGELLDGQYAKLRQAAERQYKESVDRANKTTTLARKTANDLLHAEKMLQEDRLAVMRDGLAKTIATLEEERRRRLEEINKLSVSNQTRNQLIASTNRRYNLEELKAREDFHKKYIEEEQQFKYQMDSMSGNTLVMDIEYKVNDNELQAEIKKTKAEMDSAAKLLNSFQFTWGDENMFQAFKRIGNELNELGTRQTNLQEEFDKTTKSITRMRKELEDTRYTHDDEEVYDNLVKNYEEKTKRLQEISKELDYVTKKLDSAREESKEINKMFSDTRLGERLSMPNFSYQAYKEYYLKTYNYMQEAARQEVELQKKLNEEKAALQVNELAEQLRREEIALRERYELYLKDEESIKATGKNKEELTQEFNDNMSRLQEEYRSKSEEIWEQMLQTNNKADQEFIRRNQQIYADYFNQIINLQTMFTSRIEDRANKSKSSNTNAFGLLDIVQFRKDRNEYLGELEYTLNRIDESLGAIKASYASGDLSLFDFQREYDELDQLRKRVKKTMDDLKSDNGLEDLFKGIDEWVQRLGQAVNDVLSAVFDVRNSEFEKMKEALDKEIELVSEKYDEMEELANQHKDNINAIEDELNTARGDRRAHLVDALSLEIDAQRKALAAQKAAEKEKQRLEHQSDKLELQRKKEQKRQALITAAINAALAISQAAANKWPIPALPLVALATAVGAAQIAAISAQQYREGGLLQGPSHEHGGIKVLGGRAEVEGGEYIVNRRTTSKNLGVLEFVNSSKKKLDINDFISFYSSGKNGGKQKTKFKYAEGGVLNPSLDIVDRVSQIFIERDERPVVVSVVDINRAQANLRNVETLAGIQ